MDLLPPILMSFMLILTMQVTEVKEEDVVCLVKNSATLSGTLYTLHVSQIHINLPTLTDQDKEVSFLVQHSQPKTKCEFSVHANFLDH